MFPALLLLACGGESPAPPPLDPPPDELTEGPFPEPRMGVVEVDTPAEVLRAADLQDRAAPQRLDVYFNADVTTFDALGLKLEAWGFSRIDGDGMSWRVHPPPGVEWAARLLPLEEVAGVNEAVDLIALESGAYREGSERYGTLVHTWSWREGGPVSSVSGGAAPREPMLPRALPTAVVRCLAPVRTDLLRGVSAGHGWERALVTADGRGAPMWAVVLENYGACDATGWLAMAVDASLGTLTVGGIGVAAADESSILASARIYLGEPRPVDDPSALAAWDLLQKAPEPALVEAIETAAPGTFQRRLWQALDGRDHAAALALGLSTPSLLGQVAAEDPALRGRTLADPTASTDALAAALTVWRPGPDDSDAILARLQRHPSPRVREAAWEIAIEGSSPSCMLRAEALATADITVASALYRECPQQTVRVAAFNRVASLDRQLAAAMVRVVLEEPETVRTGVVAARHMAALERYDLLGELVARPTVSRETRRVALGLMVKGKVPLATDLVDQYATYLGYVAIPVVLADDAP